MTTIGIGIPVYNDYILSSYLLDSIMCCTDRKLFNIIVLDDGSAADNRKYLEDVCKGYNVDFIYNDHNMGVPKSWNILVRHLNTDYIILLNNDIVVFDKWFENIKFFLENNDKIGTVSLPTLNINRSDIPLILECIKSNPRKRIVEILHPYNKTRRPMTHNLPESRHPVRVTSPVGCSFGFSRKAYDIVLGFNEKYYAFYEEVDFGISLYQQGYPSYILPSPHIYHVWGATFQTLQIDAQRVMNESRTKFVSKYGGDEIDVFKKLNHNFDTSITYVDSDVPRNVVIKETYSPGSCIEW